jgi:hypothetical protein
VILTIRYYFDLIEVDERAGRAAHMDANRIKCKVLMWKIEVKCSLGRSRRRWEGNVTTDRKAVE